MRTRVLLGLNPKIHKPRRSPGARCRHLTAEQKRELITKLIKATLEKFDRQIAETVKASPTTVGTMRAEMEAKVDVSKLNTRRDSKGRELLLPQSQPFSQSGVSAAPPICVTR